MVATINNDWAHTWVRIREAAKAFSDYRANYSTWLADENFFTYDKVALDTDIDPAFKGGIQTVRNALSTPLAQAVQQALLSPLLAELSRQIGKPQTDPASILPDLYDYMAQNKGGFVAPPLVQSRNVTRGAWTAGGSNVGNGTLYRLSVDRYGYPLEGDVVEKLYFQCLRDANSGTAPGEEQFRILGLPFRDELTRYTAGWGSGLNAGVGALTGVSGGTTQALIQNPSFAAFSGTGAGFVLNNWTQTSGLASGMSVSQVTADIYRACAIEQTPGALKVTSSITITQALGTRGQGLTAALAYLSRLMVNRSNYAGSGTVTVQIGSQSWSIVLAAQVGYTPLLPAFDKNLYFANFNAANLAVTITVTVTGGAILLDDFIWAPATNIGGRNIWAFGGSTNWMYYDEGTLTDTEGSNAGAAVHNTQRMFAEAYNWSLPAAVFVAQPGNTMTATPTAGGAAAQGKYAFVVTFHGASLAGVESPPSALVVCYLSGGNLRANLAVIPTGPGGTTARNIWVTQVEDVNDNTATPGFLSAFYLVGTIGDNVTTILNNVDPSTATFSSPLPTLHDTMS